MTVTTIETMRAVAARVHDTITLIHPSGDCLLLPTLDAPAASDAVYGQAQDTAGVLFDAKGEKAQAWLRARWACPHLPGQLVDEVYELLYAWYQLLYASRPPREQFDQSLKKINGAAAKMQERFEPEVARWWLAYDAGTTIADRVRRHKIKADPADRCPFDHVTQPGLHYWWWRGRHNDAQPIDQYQEMPRELRGLRFCCRHDIEPLHPTMMRANPTDADFEKYQADCSRHAAMAKARNRRVKQTPPLSSGDDLGENRFFCVPCWKAGVADGGHESGQPPCELPAPVAELIRGR